MLPPDYLRGTGVAPDVARERRRLQLLALEGGHAILARARTALERGDATAFAADLQRTQQVIVELVRTLDRAESAPIAERLCALQDALPGQLALISAERSLARLDDLLGALGPIVDAFRDVVRAR